MKGKSDGFVREILLSDEAATRALGATIAAALVPTRASALELLCDSAVQNCRTQLLNMINAENVEIDVGMWFMEDARLSNAILRYYN